MFFSKIYRKVGEGSIFAGLAVRVFANRPGDLGSIPGRVIPKTQKKWYLMPPCLTLSNIRYGSKVKWSNPGKGVAPSPTPWCSKLSKREPSGHPRLWSPTTTTPRCRGGRYSFPKISPLYPYNAEF